MVQGILSVGVGCKNNDASVWESGTEGCLEPLQPVLLFQGIRLGPGFEGSFQRNMDGDLLPHEHDRIANVYCP